MTDRRMLSPATPRATLALALVFALLGAGGCTSMRFIPSRRAAAPRMAVAPAHAPRPERSPNAEARVQAALQSTDPYWPYHLAQLQLAADSAAAAEASLREAVARDRAYAPALTLLSKLLYDAHRHADAIAVLEASRDSTGVAAPEVLAGLALHYDAIDRPDLARDVVARMPRAGADETRSAVVYVTLRGEHPDSAAALAATAARRESKSAVAQNNYGITRLRAGDPATARRAFLEAIEIDPKLPGPYYNLTILEKFYAFDDAAAARWFHHYQGLSHDDPDSLGKTFDRQTSSGRVEP